MKINHEDKDDAARAQERIAEIASKREAAYVFLRDLASKIESGEVEPVSFAIDNKIGRSKALEEGKEWEEPFYMGETRYILVYRNPTVIAALPADARLVMDFDSVLDDDDDLDDDGQPDAYTRELTGQA